MKNKIPVLLFGVVLLCLLLHRANIRYNSVMDMDMDVEFFGNNTINMSGDNPNEWYNYNNHGYSYHNPKYWEIPQQYQPVCYDEDDTFPAPIMSPGTDDLLFYKPLKGDKYKNESMDFEQKPDIVWKTTEYKFVPHAQVPNVKVENNTST